MYRSFSTGWVLLASVFVTVACTSTAFAQSEGGASKGGGALQGDVYRAHGAEEPEVVFSDAEFGGYGGPTFKFSTISGEPALLLGGRGGVLVDHVLTIGGGGYGLVNQPDADVEIGGQEPDISLGYGGVFFGATLFPNQIVHPTIGAMFGGGGVSYQFETQRDEEIDTGVFVIDGSVGAEVNLTEFARLEAAVDYLAVFGADLPKMEDSDLSGFGGHLMVKFGAF